MNAIIKIRLFLLTIMVMVGMSAFGQNIVLDRSTLLFNSSARDVSFKVHSSDVDWNVDITYPENEASGWLHVTENGSGLASDTYPVTVGLHADENVSTGERHATIIVSGGGITETVLVTQLPMVIDLVFSTQAIFANNVGGENNFTVTANVDLTLVPIDNETNGQPDWFSLDETVFEASGVSAIEKSFKVTVNKNRSLKSRRGKISIRRNGSEVAVVNVTQNGSMASVTISADAVNFESGAKTADKAEKLTVTSNVPVEISDIDYTATAGQEGWLTVTPKSANHDDATQTSDKTFTLSMNSDNTNDNERVAKFNVVWTDESGKQQSKEIKVVQMGKDIEITVSTQAIQSNNVGGDNVFTIKSNKGLTLVPIDNETNGEPSWFRLDKTTFEASGVATVEKSFKVTVDRNKSLKPRSGKISIRRNGSEVAVVTVTQNGSVASVTISADAVNFESGAKTADKAEKLTVTSNVPVEIGDIDYTATAGQEGWLTVTPTSANHDDATQTSDKTFTLSMNSDNTNDNERVAKFNVVWTDESGKQQSKEIKVVQMGKDIEITVSTQAIQSNNVGGDNVFTIKSNKGLTLVPIDNETNGEPDWFSLDETVFEASGVSAIEKSFKVTVKKNTSLKPRRGKISIRRNGSEVAVVTVTQNGSVASVTISADAVNFESGAKTADKTEKLTVTSNVPVEISDIDYTATAGQEGWLTVTPTSANHEDATQSGTKSFTLFVNSDNTDDNDRVAKFNIVWTDENGKQQGKQVSVIQMGQKSTVTVSTQAIQSNNVGGENNFTVTANVDLTLVPIDNETNGEPNWFHLDKTTFEASGVAAVEKSFKVTVNKNTSLKPRRGKISIRRNGSEIASVTISQNGSVASVTISADAVNFEPNAKTAGKTEKLTVTSNVPVEIGTIDYTATAGQEGWLTVTPKNAGHEDATLTSAKTFTLSVNSDNANDNERVAKFNVVWTDESGKQQSKEIKVVQMGKDIEINVSTQAIQSNNVGGENNFTVKSNKDLTLVTIDSETNGEPSWFHLDKTTFEASGVATIEKSFKVTVDRNKSLKPRSGRISIRRNGTEMTVVTVTQNGSVASVIISAEAVNFENNAKTIGKTEKLTVTSNVPVEIGDIDYTATAGQEGWLIVTPTSANHEDATQSDTKSFTLSVISDNANDNERVAKFNVVWTDENDNQQSKKVSVIQMGRISTVTVSTQLIQSNNVGGENNFTVTANVDLTLVPIDNETNGAPNWFSLDETNFKASGVAAIEKSFKVTVNKNTSLKPRSGKISIRRNGSEIASVNVTQNGSVASVTIAADAVNFEPNAKTTGKAEKLTVTSNVPLEIGTIDYTATAGQEGWLTVTPTSADHEDATQSGTKSFTLSVNSDNIDDNERVAKFNIVWTDDNGKQQNKQVSVIQMGRKSTVTVSTQAIQSNNVGGENNFSVTANVDLTLVPIDNETNGTPNWFSLDETNFKASGVAAVEKSFKVTVNRNKSLKPRSGKISIRRNGSEVAVVTITQNGSSASVTSSVDALNFESNAKTTGKVEKLTVTSNVPITIGAIDYTSTAGQTGWLTIAPTNAGHDDATQTSAKTFTLSVNSDNANDNERVAKFNIVWTNENGKQQSKQVSVIQMGRKSTVTVSTQAIQSNNVGGENNFTVTANVDLTLVTIDNETNGAPNWFNLDETTFKASGIAAVEKSFKVTVDRNKSLKPRTGKISIRRNGSEIASVTVSQNGSVASVTIAADAVNFEPNAKTTGKAEKLTVTSNVPVEIGTIDYTATAGQEGWLTVTPMSADHEDATQSGTKSFTLSANSDNTDDNDRVAKFNIVWTDENGKQQGKQVSVIQMGRKSTVTVSTLAIQSNNVGGENNFTVTANIDLTLVPIDNETNGAPNWFSLDETNFKASGVAAIEKSFKVTVNKNTSLKPRSGKISIRRNGSEIAVVTVTQNGSVASVIISADAVNFESNAKTSGKTEKLTVTSNVPVEIGTIDYTATAGQEGWLSVTPTNAGHEDATQTDSKAFMLSVNSDNTDDNERVAKFNVVWTDESGKQQSKEIKVVQMSKDIEITVSTQAIQSNNVGGENNFTVKSNKDLTLVTIDSETNGEPSWFHLDKTSFEASGVAAIEKSFKLTVDRNKSLKPRSGKISIRRNGSEIASVTVSQNGSVASVTISADAVNFEPNAKTTGKAEKLTVTSNVPVEIGDIDYTATAGQENWLTVTPTKAGHEDVTQTDTKTFTLSANSDNTNDNERVAKFNVLWTDENGKQQTKQVSVIQMGQKTVVAVSTQSIQSNNVGGENYFTVTANVGLTLVPIDNETNGEPTWFRLDNSSFQASGVSAVEKSFKLTIDNNRYLKPRNGKISIRRNGSEVAAITVTQNGSQASVTISADAVNFESGAKTAGKAENLIVTSNVPVAIGTIDYTATAGQEGWLTVTPMNVGHDDATQTSAKVFTLSVNSDNTSDNERMAKFNVTWTDETGKLQAKDIKVVQMGKDIEITVSTQAIQSNNVGGQNSFTIKSNKDLTLVTIDNETNGEPNWFRLDETLFNSTGVASIEKSFKLTVDKNKSLKPRSGKISIRRNGSEVAVVGVLQNGSIASATISADAVNFESGAMTSGKAERLTVTANVPVEIGAIDYTATAGQEGWLTVSPRSASHDDATQANTKTFTLSVNSDNTSDNERVARFDVVWNDENGKQQSKQVSVIQMGQKTAVTVSTQTITANNVGGISNFNITANVNLTLVPIDNETNGEPGWFRLDENAFNASGVSAIEKTFKVTVDKNKSLKPRSGKISIRRNGLEVAVVTVSQNGSIASVTISSKDLNFESSANTEGKTEKVTVTANVPISIDNIDYTETAGQEGWLSVNPMNIDHDDATQASVKEFMLSVNSDNTSGEDRIAKFKLVWTDENGKQAELLISVKQTGYISIVQVEPQEITLANVDRQSIFSINSNEDLTLVPMEKVDDKMVTPDWFRLDKNEFKSDGANAQKKYFTLEADDNKSLKPRQGWISIRRKDSEVLTIPVTQNGSVASVAISAEAVNFEPNAKTTNKTEKLTVTSNVPVMIGVIDYSSTTGQEGWLTVTPSEAGHDDATKTSAKTFMIFVNSDNANDNDRVAKFSIVWTDEKDRQQSRLVSVVQMGRIQTVTVRPQTIQSNNIGSVNNFTLSANVDLTLESIDNETGQEASWFRLDDTAFKADGVAPIEKSFKLTVDKNKSLKPRNGKISIYRNSIEVAAVTVTQNGSSAKVTVGDAEVEFRSGEKSKEFIVDSNVPMKIGSIRYSGVGEQPDWLTVNPESASHDDATEQEEKLFTLFAKLNNTSGENRKAEFDVVWTDEKGQQQSKTVVVIQKGATFAVKEVKSNTFLKDGQTLEFQVQTDSIVSWCVELGDATWLKANPNADSGDKTVKITADRNPQNGTRFAWVKILQTNTFADDKPLCDSIKFIQCGQAFFDFDTVEDIEVASAEHQFSVKADGSWTLKVDTLQQKWLRFNDSSGSVAGDNSAVVNYRVDAAPDKNWRSATVTAYYTDSLGRPATKLLTITQRGRPETPRLQYVVKGDVIDSNIFDATINEEIELKFLPEDIISDWSFDWYIDGKEPMKDATNTIHILPQSKESCSIKVEVHYKDALQDKDLDKELMQTFDYTLFPAPLPPTKLEMKGTGTSGIMIASLDGISDDDLRANGYQFVFGYDHNNSEKAFVPTSNRYWQYDDNSVVQNDGVNKWVYTQWSVKTRNGDERIVKSKMRRNTIGEKYTETPVTRGTTSVKALKSTTIFISSERLLAHVSKPARANITVISLAGAIVRQLTFGPDCDFNEPLDFSGLPAGIYIMRCTIGSNSVEQKVVIK